jgi:hypothetical protein
MEKKTTMIPNKEQIKVLAKALEERDILKEKYLSALKSLDQLIIGITGQSGFSNWEIKNNEITLTFPETFKEKVETQIREKNLEEVKNEQ